MVGETSPFHLNSPHQGALSAIAWLRPSVIHATLAPKLNGATVVGFKVVLPVAMRAKLVIAALLWLVSTSQGFAGQEPRYTTLVVEYAGEQDRYISPVVISTSSEEGEWYRQHLWPQPLGGDLVFVQVVPASVLNKITELPLLTRQLERGDDEPKTLMDVEFTAGVGHDRVQVIVDDLRSAKILKDIAGVVANYSDLKSELQEIADHVNPLTFHNLETGEIEYKAATEAGFRTRGWPHAHFGFAVFKASTGKAVTVNYGDFATPGEAKRFFDWKAHKASLVLWRDTQKDGNGNPIGYRYRAEVAPQRKRRNVEFLWVVGVAVQWIDSADFDEALELEGQYRYSAIECPSNSC